VLPPAVEAVQHVAEVPVGRVQEAERHRPEGKARP
jgi:hypothetical protein